MPGVSARICGTAHVCMLQRPSVIYLVCSMYIFVTCISCGVCVCVFVSLCVCVKPILHPLRK